MTTTIRDQRLTLSETLRQVIRESGQTVTQVVRGSGVPQPTMYRFLLGQRDLTFGRAQQLADYSQLELRPARHRQQH